MYRKPRPRQETCFIPGSLSDYVPEDHILKRVHAVLDLSWLAEEVKDLYAEGGWPCIRSRAHGARDAGWLLSWGGA